MASTNETMERQDLVVIGAGWYGLGAAKQYYSFHPDDAITILDSANSIGGVWAKERLYPSLKSNNLVGTYEYPDFPMDEATFGVKPREHIPGTVVQQYLEAYARHFGIIDFVQLQTRVVSAEHQSAGGWILTIQQGWGQETTTIFAKRLILSTGLVSEPFKPHIEGQEEFGKPLFHAKEFGINRDTFEPGKRVTIFGGTKYAWDAAYAYGTRGIGVDWIIRPTGHGPAWMAPPFVTPLKKQLEALVNMRMVHWFAPCIWGQDSGYRGIKAFWHGTRIGRKVVDKFWNVLKMDTLGLMPFDKDPEFKKLEPTCDPLYTGCSFSIFNYDTDFFEPIRNGTVKIHCADLSHLSPGKVHLDDENKTVLDSDAMMYVTGWKSVPALKFLPEGIERKIGLPHITPQPGSPCEPDDGLAEQTDLIAKADKEILQRFPSLKRPPPFNPDYKPLTDTKAFSVSQDDAHAPEAPDTPMMLYRFMVPGTSELLAAKDIAFCGAIHNFSGPTTAHLQGLWVSAYFDGKLVRDPSRAVPRRGSSGSSSAVTLERVHWETVLHNRFGRWRYPHDQGKKQPDFVFEAIPYMDMLLADLGLRMHRKGGWLREMYAAYGPRDYVDANEEWQTKHGTKYH